MRYLLLILTFAFTAQLEVDGNLKVTGTMDASGNAITNVGEPVLISDVATANYVNSRTSAKGRIITLKCPWFYSGFGEGSCEPPQCPDTWSQLGTSTEVSSVEARVNGNSNYSDLYTVGNSIRYCIEQEDSE